MRIAAASHQTRSPKHGSFKKTDGYGAGFCHGALHTLSFETMDKFETANHLYAKLGFQRLERPLDGSEHTKMDRWYLKELVRE
ncbi:hypothetical protein [Sporosarcina sp. Te-1]|uniref:hypothetical protein n=1 Tax=Sporosarcina sp. Te-1 TaxID=2818390 RepID=UPI001A9D0906|nr:hypothetical protein [Sporosarcina sp. Te-1]QTD39461.1 hypothetical protein J3U78_11295 [Sporosarcina sp. Te-1]